MKLFLRIVQILLLVIVLVFLSALFFVDRIASRGLPDYEKDVNLRNMTAEVEIFRDTHGIPHIYAETEEDLYRAVGYVMAQDRLWQMDLMRRGTEGRLAEIFGEDLVGTDALMRSLRIGDKSEEILKNLPPEIRLALFAFSDGINQYIERYPKALPPEFSILGYKPEPWEPKHSVNMIGYMSWDLTSGYRNKITLHQLLQQLGEEKVKAFLPETAFHQTLVFPGLQDTLIESDLYSAFEKLNEMGLTGVFHGSNNWAVNKFKTRTGLAIMCNDMHLGYFAPGIWYQMHCVVNGRMDVTGVAVPGQPFVICGHNEHIAWGMTNVGSDDTDFYIERLSPDSTKYFFNNRWASLDVREENIKTKSGDVHVKKLLFTHRGPIISAFRNIDEAAISMRWIGNEPSNEILGIYRLSHARNWEDFREACSHFKAVSQNIIYADIEGNIGLQTAAGVPLKNDHYYSVYPGETDEYDWKGLMAFDKLPYSYNPESGMLSSANNRIAGEHYPFFISHWPDVPYRIDRIRELLEQKNYLGVEDMKAMHLDQHSLLYRDLKPQLTAALNNAFLEPMEQEAYTLLKTWDGQLDKDAAAPAILQMFYMKFLEHTIGDEMDSLHYDMFLRSTSFVRNYMLNVWNDPDSPWPDDVSTPDITENLQDMIRISFRSTVRELAAIMGDKPEKWQWGNIHALTLEHPMGGVKILARFFNLNRGPYPVGGDCFNVGQFAYRYHNPFKVVHGPSHRHIYTTDDWDRSLSIIPTGTSGIPKSPYYCDQTKLFINGEYHPDYVSKQLVRGNAKYRMVIR